MTFGNGSGVSTADPSLASRKATHSLVNPRVRSIIDVPAQRCETRALCHPERI